ncbi:unnamed protein product [Echinostoma caproni]|uniref:Peptidase_S9 domain-containing protein n=1 Tax=Echinostoma caproni TaxID=27848 RepID=A0A183AGD6_9TREM|nr:unnamed protein product [Echinostoma caproni]
MEPLHAIVPDVGYQDLTGTHTRQPAKWVITPEFDITDILHFNGENEFIFLGTGPDSKNSHVFFGTTTDNNVKCLTCGNENCTYNRARVSNCGMFFVQECRGPDVPTFILNKVNKTRLESGDLLVEAVPVRVLQDNKEFKTVLRERALARIEYMHLTLRKGTRDQMEVEAKLWLPPELNKSHITKYPLLLYTALVEELPFVNTSQIGAYGWSYGGFTVGHLLGHSENTYARCGIAVAPVTDFKYYELTGENGIMECRSQLHSKTGTEILQHSGYCL